MIFKQAAQNEVRLSRLLEHQSTGYFLSAVLFATHFLLFYFICIFAFEEGFTGLIRLALCWLGAYALTWICSYLVTGKARLILTLLFVCILVVVFMFRL